MNGWILATIITVAVLVVVLRRVLGEPLTTRDLWVAPVVLTCIGLWTLIRTDGLGAADYVWTIGGSALGATLGYLRGSLVVLFERAGYLWQRYIGKTFAVVIGSLLAMAAFGVLAEKLGMRAEARPIQLSIGISFLAESLAVTRRGLALRVPFAPEGTRR